MSVGDLAEAQHTFAGDVREGLCAAEKHLPARYLYDDVGSALYEAITLLPEYYLTRAETAILQEFAGEILARAGDAEIVELGPGNGAKTRIVLEAALRRQERVRYRPIDISASALRALERGLRAEYQRLDVIAHCGDYRSEVLDRSQQRNVPMLVMFLGSSIGNYDPTEAENLVRALARSMDERDALLLGADLKKPRAALELAYDDPGGVTAAFNRNVLVRINRELGGTFDLNAFAFRVSYDEERACVDSFQESLRDQVVRIAALDVDVPFRKGERIRTESSYKYDAASIDRLARASGLSVEAAWQDSEKRFSVSLLRTPRQ